MQLVIIAGGLGKRLRPLTLTQPKALIPLVDRPIIVHAIDGLPDSCDEILIAVNYGFEAVQDYFRENAFDVPIRVVHEPVALGTAGAIKNMERHISGPFVAYNGDVIDTIDFDRLVEAHRKGHGIGTIALWPVEDPSEFGAVEIRGDRITRFVEKPPRGGGPGVVNAGRYVFESRVFDFIEGGREVSLEREVFPRLIEHGLTPHRYEGWWSDAGTLSNYLEAQRLLLAAGRAKVAPGADVSTAVLTPPVYVGAGSFIEGRAGPNVSFGRGCKIGRARIRDAAILGGASVDDKANIASSILGPGVAIGEGAEVRDSILGEGVQVPPHAKVHGERLGK
jgi:mannose-1-phosphate guanylyltransferase